MTENSYMFITGPNVVKAVMQEDVTLEELGGGLIHSQESGVSHFLAKDDSGMPDARCAPCSPTCPPTTRTTRPTCRPWTTRDRRCPELEQIVPIDPHKPYDVRQVIASIVDDGRFFEVHELWAENMVWALPASTVG